MPQSLMKSQGSTNTALLMPYYMQYQRRHGFPPGATPTSAVATLSGPLNAQAHPAAPISLGSILQRAYLTMAPSRWHPLAGPPSETAGKLGERCDAVRNDALFGPPRTPSIMPSHYSYLHAQPVYGLRGPGYSGSSPGVWPYASTCHVGPSSTAWRYAASPIAHINTETQVTPVYQPSPVFHGVIQDHWQRVPVTDLASSGHPYNMEPRDAPGTIQVRAYPSRKRGRHGAAEEVRVLRCLKWRV